MHDRGPTARRDVSWTRARQASPLRVPAGVRGGSAHELDDAVGGRLAGGRDGRRALAAPDRLRAGLEHEELAGALGARADSPLDVLRPSQRPLRALADLRD